MRIVAGVACIAAGLGAFFVSADSWRALQGGVIGASVFPTTGGHNPTLTVQALNPEGRPHGDTGPVVVNASCTFLLPLVYPGELEVRMYLGEPGRSSVGSFYEIWHDGRKFADGAAKIVWIDVASGRPVPLPDEVRAPLQALEPG